MFPRTVHCLRSSSSRFFNDQHQLKKIFKQNVNSFTLGGGSILIKRDFRLSTPTRAIPPLIWAVLRPLSQIGAALFGRTFRKWWFNLPPDRQRHLYEMFMKSRKRLAIGGCGLAGAAVIYYYYHTELTPISNRRRFITMTQNQFKVICDMESQLHLAKFQQAMLPDYDRRVNRVKRVAAQLIKGNPDIHDLKEKSWHVHVVDLPLANCYVIPNGHIFMFTGMLDTFANDDQLAIVLGHEMTHALLGHGLEQTSWVQVVDFMKIGVIAAIWAIIPFPIGAAFTHWFSTMVLNVVMELPYSRTLEKEADDVGLHIATKACFDPRESYAFWLALRMKDKVEGNVTVPNFLRTHPNHGDRAERFDLIINDCLNLRIQCNCPPLKQYDPRLLADYKKQMIEEQMALQGKV